MLQQNTHNAFHEHLSCLLNNDAFQIHMLLCTLSLFVFVQLYEVITVQLHIFIIVGLCVTVAQHLMALTSSLAPLPTFCLSKLSSHWLPLINPFEFLGGGICLLAEKTPLFDIDWSDNTTVSVCERE